MKKLIFLLCLLIPSIAFAGTVVTLPGPTLDGDNTFTGSLHLNDNVHLTFGNTAASPDGDLYPDGSNNIFNVNSSLFSIVGTSINGQLSLTRTGFSTITFKASSGPTGSFGYASLIDVSQSLMFNVGGSRMHGFGIGGVEYFRVHKDSALNYGMAQIRTGDDNVIAEETLGKLEFVAEMDGSGGAGENRVGAVIGARGDGTWSVGSTEEWDAESYIYIAVQSDGTAADGLLDDKVTIGNKGVRFLTGITQNRTAVTADATSTYDSYYFGCDTVGADTVAIRTLDIAVAGRVFIIKDEGGNASAQNITIITEGAETIDGSATAVISGDYDSISLISNGSNLFIH